MEYLSKRMFRANGRIKLFRSFLNNAIKTFNLKVTLDLKGVDNQILTTNTQPSQI